MTHSHVLEASCQMVVVPGDTPYFSLKHTVEIRVAARKLQREISSQNPLGIGWPHRPNVDVPSPPTSEHLTGPSASVKTEEKLPPY